MEKKTNLSFEEIMEQDERRVHIVIYKLNIEDPYGEFYQEGLVAIGDAYETHQPDLGALSTYINYTIRQRLIYLLRVKDYMDA